MTRIKNFKWSALMAGTALLIAPLVWSAGGQTLMTAELLDHTGTGGEPPNVLSSCSGVTTFPLNTSSIIARFVGAAPCLNPIQFYGPNGMDDDCDDDDVCLYSASIHAIRDKKGVVTSARLYLWDASGSLFTTDTLANVYSGPAAPAHTACFTVHIDRIGIAVRPGEAKGKGVPASVGSISVDDVRACPLA